MCSQFIFIVPLFFTIVCEFFSFCYLSLSLTLAQSSISWNSFCWCVVRVGISFERNACLNCHVSEMCHSHCTLHIKPILVVCHFMHLPIGEIIASFFHILRHTFHPMHYNNFYMRCCRLYIQIIYDIC